MYCKCGRCSVWIILIVGLVAVADDRSNIRARLEAALPHLTITSVSPTALPGFYEVEIAGQASVLHVDLQGDHIIAGDMYFVTKDGLVNLTESRREQRRRELFENMGVATMIVFPSHRDTRAIVSVFTDVTCSFCQKLHQEIDELNSYGIEVRYLAYPPYGPDSETYDLMVSAWCSEDKQLAITELKSGGTIPASTCENPVRMHWELGRSIGVEGTPTLITESGVKISGYVPAADLAIKLGLLEAQ